MSFSQGCGKWVYILRDDFKKYKFPQWAGQYLLMLWYYFLEFWIWVITCQKERTWHRGVPCGPRCDLENWLAWLLELSAYNFDLILSVSVKNSSNQLYSIEYSKRNPGINFELILCSEFYQIGSCSCMCIYFLVDVNF